MDINTQKQVLRAALRAAGEAGSGQPAYVPTVVGALDDAGYEIVQKAPVNHHDGTDTFLVGISVAHPDQWSTANTERWLHHRLNCHEFKGDSSEVAYIEEWWVAEDERHDGSDNESAVMIPGGLNNGMGQAEARELLSAIDRIYRANLYSHDQLLRLLESLGDER